MHKVKSQAKQSAWVREQGGEWNPFGKYGRKDSRATTRVNSRSNSLDPEKALSPRRTNDLSRATDASTEAIEPVEPVEPPSTTESPNSDTPIHPSMRQRFNGLLHPGDKKSQRSNSLKRKDSKTTKKFTIWGQLRVTLFGSWVNLLLICVPVGIALHYTKNIGGVVVFVINFLAIIPLAGMLSYATEELSMRVGETLGGLLNASFGNAVELIVSIIALAQGEYLIVQTSLIGSMLSNLLLVMGMCFFFGGLKRPHQNFNITVAQTASSLLALAVGSLVIPTIFVDWGDAGTPATRSANMIKLSRGVSVILLFVYGCYLFFQLKTHASLYNEKSEKVDKRASSKETGNPNVVRKGLTAMGIGSGAHTAGALFGKKNANKDNEDQVVPQTEREQDSEEANYEEEEQPQLSLVGAVVTLCVATALVGICAEFMVDGIAAVTKPPNGISPEFVGLILIPIVGNAAEHATAVTVAVKDKMDLAIGVAVGSSMQIALLVLPLVVIIGWIMGRPEMNLQFDGFLIALIFITVLLVNYLIADGRSHWLEGVLLMATYVIIAVAAYLYPQTGNVVG